MKVARIISDDGLGTAPAGWRDLIGDAVEQAMREVYDPAEGRLARLSMGRCMRALRGRVPATEVALALSQEIQARRENVPG